MDILTYDTLSEFATIGDAWERLSEREPRFVSSFTELRHQLESSKAKFRVVVAVEDSEVAGIACFVHANAKKHYYLAEMKLFDLSVRQISLFDSCILGQLDEATIARMLRRILDDTSFDLLDLGHIIIGSPLYKAATTLRGGVIAGRVSRRDQIQWLIRLPETFDAYVTSLGVRTRQNAVRRFRQLDRNPAFEVKVFHRRDQIDKFLQDGETISRLTYQWNLNSRLCNDAPTRARFLRLAEKGVLRCYIAYFDGQPCAFSHGEWHHGFYVTEQLGYDPRFGKKSPGTALFLCTIRDLIENTDCEWYDYDVEGYFDYKTKFGTSSLKCVRMQIGYLYRPYSFCLIALDQINNAAKNLISFIVERTRLMQWLDRQRAKWLRRYGAA